MSATIYKATGETVPVSPANGTDFTLDELQKIVGGYVQVIPVAKNRLLVLNEDGYSLNLPTNDIATVRFPFVCTFRARGIVGDVLECDRNQIQ